MQLKKLTTRYVVDEDRFLISADSDSGVVNLWLTQRLLMQLIPHVVDWVDKGEAKDVGNSSFPAAVNDTSGSPDSGRSGASPAARQSASQLVAQHRRPVEDVRAEAAVKECLVKTLKLQPQTKALCLGFELSGDVATLLLEEEHARIWLGVLYRHWLNAKWPDIWPEWIKQAERMRQTSPGSLTH